MFMSELNLHRSVSDFLDWMLLPPAMWTTFPAGWTAMRAGAAGRLKGCGLKAGMPDILVFYNGFTIGIELKSSINNLSKAQRAMFDKLRKAGVMTHVCRSIDEVYEALAMCHRVPMRNFSYAPRIKASEGGRPQESPQGAGSAPA